MDPEPEKSPRCRKQWGEWLRCGSGDKYTQWEETGEQNPRNTVHALEGGVSLREGPCRKKANFSDALIELTPDRPCHRGFVPWPRPSCHFCHIL